MEITRHKAISCNVGEKLRNKVKPENFGDLCSDAEKDILSPKIYQKEKHALKEGQKVGE